MSDVPAFLRAHGLKPNPNWGQHFLIDPSVLRTLLEKGDVTRADTVFEIGAGIGVLTKELVAHAGKVIAVEVDRRWIPLLEEYVGPQAMESGRLEIVQGNGLKVPYPDEPYKIVANIPYHITSHLFRHAFLGVPHRPQSLTLLVQREVADKICASKRGEARTILTLLVEFFGEPTYVRSVSPGAFLPPPKVDSAVIHVTSFKEPRGDQKTLDALLRLTSLAFTRKRKMLRRSIGKIYGGAELLEMASIDPERRPETLTIEEWIAVAEAAVNRGG